MSSGCVFERSTLWINTILVIQVTIHGVPESPQLNTNDSMESVMRHNNVYFHFGTGED